MASLTRAMVTVPAVLAVIVLASSRSTTDAARAVEREPMDVAGGTSGCSVRPAAATAQSSGVDWSRMRVIRDLHDEEALAYVRARRARDIVFNHVQGRALADLRLRGLKPTNFARAAVIEVPKAEPALQRVLLDRVLRLIAPTVHAEQFESYEIILQSWDDGVETTWEGNSYVENLQTAEWMSSNGQEALPAEPYVAHWADYVDHNMFPQWQCRKLGSACGYCGDSNHARCNFDTALMLSWEDCAFAAAGCRLSGPSWPGCIGIFCYGRIFSNWIKMTKQHLQNCWLDEAERQACGG